MAEPADIIAGVVEVVGVATEWRVVAQILAVFLAVDGLPNRVNGLQDLSLDLTIPKLTKRFFFCSLQINFKMSYEVPFPESSLNIFF